ncbi:sodium/glucose cotransporter 4 isoform X1 [Folsomia candida]|uniref:sodium/glucose cotransporter 4 isoform X1 n=1 Tax=Folsomia candida TaxID=158441 RepID=UPI000B8F9BEF|nr:sodium/glucose cotransporter 4 isoform X1 [Folsomia candida]
MDQLISSSSSTDLEAPSNHLNWVDFAVIAVYFIFVLGVGLYSSFRSKRSSVQGYFLASRSMHWLPVGASLFASNIGSGHFIGLAGSGAASGIGIASFELNAIFVILILGWIFVPVYMAAGVYTMPEYLRLRFGGQRIRVYLAVLALILYVFTKISADLYAGALFIQLALGFGGDEGLYISILILLAIAALFTIAGGLTAVMWTDFVQTILMIIGAMILMVLSFNAVGGYQELIRKYMDESEPSPNATLYDEFNKSCGAVPRDAMNLFRSVHPGESDLPWTGVIFGMTISSIWYWCSDQVIVQRVLASKNMINAKGGCLLAGMLKLLPLYLLVFPGMAARVLYTDRVACADPEVCQDVCGSTTGCTNIAYAELVIKLMPTGLSGMMLAVMMAALMSSLTSIFNSSSTIFTIDIWTRLRKNPSDTELVIVGRTSVLALLAISVVWVPILKELKASQLFVYIQQVSNFLSPPVTAVFLLAFFYGRTNEAGAFWGLMTGLALGLFRFVMEFSFQSPTCGSGEVDSRPEWVRAFVDDIHYLHYGCIIFIVTLVITYVVSILTPPIDPEKLHRLTFWTRHSQQVRKPIDDYDEKKKSDAGSDSTPRYDADSMKEGSCSKFMHCICGVDSKAAALAESLEQGPKLTPEEEAVAASKFLDEEQFWKRFVNSTAILLMTAAVFMWSFYA